MSYENMIETESVTLDQTDSVANAISSAIDLNGVALVGIQMPSSWTAASITFEVSFDGTTFVDMYDHDVGEYEITTAAANRYIKLIPEDFAGVRWIKVRSGTGTTPVSNNVTLQLVKRPI